MCLTLYIKHQFNTVGLLNKSASPNLWLSSAPTTVLVLNATGFISRLLNKSVRWSLIINDFFALVKRRFKKQIIKSALFFIYRCMQSFLAIANFDFSVFFDFILRNVYALHEWNKSRRIEALLLRDPLTFRASEFFCREWGFHTSQKFLPLQPHERSYWEARLYLENNRHHFTTHPC